VIIHHVNETVPPAQGLYWDIGFLVWGAAMVVAGWLMIRVGEARRRSAIPLTA
jgi:uncharacterized membrane protein